MTRALNASVQTAAGKPANETVPVGCITCHRGVPIPRQLTDVLWTTTVRQGAAATVTQYRELRTQFYGKQAYDFGEDTLITIASRIGQARPEDAIALMDLNLEFFPRSVRSHVTLAIAQSRRDAPAAVATLKKALEIEPENGEIKGRLYQLEQTVERQNRSQPAIARPVSRRRHLSAARPAAAVALVLFRLFSPLVPGCPCAARDPGLLTVGWRPIVQFRRRGHLALVARFCACGPAAQHPSWSCCPAR